MIYCKNCGAEIAEGANFCKQCGSPVPTSDGQPFSSTLSVVENDSPMTLQTLKSFYRTMRVCAIIILCCAALLLLLSLVLIHIDDFNWQEDYQMLLLSPVFAAVGVAFLLLYRKLSTGNKMFTDQTHQLYRFTEEGILAEFYDGDRKCGETFATYAQISHVAKRKDFLMIYFGNQVWLVNRNYYTLGRDEDLKNLLTQKGIRGAHRM